MFGPTPSEKEDLISFQKNVCIVSKQNPVNFGSGVSIVRGYETSVPDWSSNVKTIKVFANSLRTIYRSYEGTYVWIMLKINTCLQNEDFQLILRMYNGLPEATLDLLKRFRINIHSSNN